MKLFNSFLQQGGGIGPTHITVIAEDTEQAIKKALTVIDADLDGQLAEYGDLSSYTIPGEDADLTGKQRSYDEQKNRILTRLENDMRHFMREVPTGVIISRRK